MRNQRTPIVLMLLLLAGGAPPVTAKEGDDAAETSIREIFVPFDDLSVVLQNRIRRVFVSREAYEELLAKAKKAPAEKAPQSTATVSSDYDVTVEEGRAE